jgi:hypothetical protein
MFSYRLVHAREFPSLAQGQAWPDLLSPREERDSRRARLRAEKAQVADGPGRGQASGARHAGRRQVPEKKISVLNQPSGEPFVLIEGKGGWEYPISISHRSEVGMAASPLERTARIGADLETVEPRDPALGAAVLHRRLKPKSSRPRARIATKSCRASGAPRRRS